MIEWINVADRVPENVQIVVCMGSEGLPFVAIFYGNSFLYEFIYEKETSKYVKYWMPLPEVPND